MIVEFIGSTGAGKTTLIAGVRRKLAKTSPVTSPFELIASPLGLEGVTQPTARNLIQELAGFLFFLRSLGRRKEFIGLALKMLARQARFSIFTINNLRSLERKVGVYEIIKRSKRQQIILVDEGPLLLAHNMFVYSDAVYTDEEIAGFASLVPLPDAIIYVRAPVETLVQRSLLRSDPPREIKSRNQSLIEKHIKRAVGVFDQLVKAERIQHRLLIVDNPNLEQRDDVIDEIIEFILSCELGGKASHASYQMALERPK